MCLCGLMKLMNTERYRFGWPLGQKSFITIYPWHKLQNNWTNSIGLLSPTCFVVTKGVLEIFFCTLKIQSLCLCVLVSNYFDLVWLHLIPFCVCPLSRSFPVSEIKTFFLPLIRFESCVTITKENQTKEGHCYYFRQLVKYWRPKYKSIFDVSCFKPYICIKKIKQCFKVNK